MPQYFIHTHQNSPCWKKSALELAKAKKDSSTSSKPPSGDIAKPKPKKKPGRRKKPRRGGQPGHQRQLRELLPPDRVDETIEFEIDAGEAQRLGGDAHRRL